MKTFNFLFDKSDDLFSRHAVEILSVTKSGGYFSGLNLFVPDYQHIRDFLQLGFTDFESKFFIPEIVLNPDTGCAQRIKDLSAIWNLIVGDGKHNCLHRGKP